MSKKIVKTGLASVLIVSSIAQAAEIRDQAFGMSSKATDSAFEMTREAYAVTRDYADFTAESLKVGISKAVELSVDSSVYVSEKIIDLVDLSAPALKLTKDGLILVLDSSKATSENIVLLLKPSSELSSDVVITILEKLAQGSAASANISKIVLQYMYDTLKEPVTFTSDQFVNLMRWMHKNISVPSAEASKSLYFELVLLMRGSSESSYDLMKLLRKKFEKELQSTTNATEFISEKLGEVTTQGSELSSEVVEKIIDLLVDGSITITDAIDYVLENYEEQLRATSNASAELSEAFFRYVIKNPVVLTSNVIEFISDTITDVVGEDNIMAASELTSDGITITFEGIVNVFYVISKGTTGVYNFLFDNRDSIQEAQERGDEDIQQSLRELVRNAIKKDVENGEQLNMVINDKAIDVYIDTVINSNELIK